VCISERLFEREREDTDCTGAGPHEWGRGFAKQSISIPDAEIFHCGLLNFIFPSYHKTVPGEGSPGADRGVRETSRRSEGRLYGFGRTAGGFSQLRAHVLEDFRA